MAPVCPPAPVEGFTLVMTPRPGVSIEGSQACVSEQPAHEEPGRRGHRRGGRSLSLLFPAEDGCNNVGAAANTCRAYFALDGDSDCSSFSGSDSEDAPEEGEVADLACDALELSDMYSFDAGPLAAALQKGASFAELRDTVQEELTAAFERRLQEEMSVPEQELVELVDDDAAATVAAATLPERACLDEDLSGRMTPGRATPPEGPEGVVADAGVDPELLSTAAGAAAAAREGASRRCSHLRASRSSIAGSRKSIAGARRRLSLSRATEVVSLVESDGVDAPRGGEPARGVEFVQNVIEEARQRHRQSISNVMKQLGVQSTDDLVQTQTPSSTCSTMSVVTDESKFPAAAAGPEPEDELSALLRERIKVAMAGALARQKQRQAEAEAEAAASAAKERNRWSAQTPVGYYSNQHAMCGVGWFGFPMVIFPFGWVAPYPWPMHGQGYYQPRGRRSRVR